MSHLDYLNKKEWKKLGIIILTAFFTLQTFLTLFYYFGPGVPEVGIYRKYLISSVLYALSFSIISFLFLYAKGEKVFRVLILLNFLTPFVLILYVFLFLIFGPHG